VAIAAAPIVIAMYRCRSSSYVFTLRERCPTGAAYTVTSGTPAITLKKPRIRRGFFQRRSPTRKSLAACPVGVAVRPTSTPMFIDDVRNKDDSAVILLYLDESK